jgi:hypothetical protein
VFIYSSPVKSCCAEGGETPAAPPYCSFISPHWFSCFSSFDYIDSSRTILFLPPIFWQPRVFLFLLLVFFPPQEKEGWPRSIGSGDRLYYTIKTRLLFLLLLPSSFSLNFLGFFFFLNQKKFKLFLAVEMIHHHFGTNLYWPIEVDVCYLLKMCYSRQLTSFTGE